MCYASAVWKEKSDTIQFSDTALTISRYYLEDEKQSQEKDAASSNNQPKLQALESDSDERRGRFFRTNCSIYLPIRSNSLITLACLPPRCMADLLSQLDDFKQSLPLISYWYGLHDYLVIYPMRTNDSIMTESKANILLSSIAIAINNTGW